MKKKKNIKKSGAKKSAGSFKKNTTETNADCECIEDEDGIWYRFVNSGGKKKRIPPAFSTQEACEKNCAS